MTIGQIMNKILEYYGEANKSNHIKKPMAWSVYQTWKWVDEHERKFNERDNANPVIHGHWTIIKDEYGNLLNQCSECLEVWDDDLNDFHASDLDFCPFCGAKMDEKVTPCDTCAKNGKCQLQSFDVVKNGEMAYCNCKEEK